MTLRALVDAFDDGQRLIDVHLLDQLRGVPVRAREGEKWKAIETAEEAIPRELVQALVFRYLEATNVSP